METRPFSVEEALAQSVEEALAKTDHDLGLTLWAWWAASAYQAKRRSGEITDATHAPLHITDAAAASLREATLAVDSDNIANAGLEKALRAAASGDLDRAGKHFRSYLGGRALHGALVDEFKTGRRKQRANAKKPRQDELAALILEIVREDPQRTEAQVLKELRRHEGKTLIHEIDDENICFKDGRKEVPLTGLKDRISRARKKVSSR